MLSFKYNGKNTLFAAPSGRQLVYDTSTPNGEWRFSPDKGITWYATDYDNTKRESAYPTAEAWTRFACTLTVEGYDLTGQANYDQTVSTETMTFAGETYERQPEAPAEVTITKPVYPRELVTVVYSRKLDRLLVIVRNDAPRGKSPGETLYRVDPGSLDGTAIAARFSNVRQHDDVSVITLLDSGRKLVRKADGRWLLDDETTTVLLVNDYRFSEDKDHTTIQLTSR